MPDGTSSLVGGVWEVIKYPFVLVMGLMGWSLKRQVGRIDKIDEAYVSHETFNVTLESLRADSRRQTEVIGDGFKEVRQDIRNLHSRIDKIKDSAP